ncbi:hypothetical protein [Shewanella algae]|uniref:hypothetical protein n=1 Tax=Shewanella algae TaxID=38313 RepID=UPI001C902E41|nr:hypothetical protein [Shewanella algae]
MLKQCVGDKTWRKLKQFITSDNSINEMEIDKFYRVIDTISAEVWAKYLRKIRDKEYEENRSRISISRKTEEHLKLIVNEVGYKNIEDVLAYIFINNDELKEIVTRRLRVGIAENVEADVFKMPNQKNINESFVPRSNNKPKGKPKKKPVPRVKPNQK